MDYRAFLATLSAADRAELTTTSNSKGGLHLLLYLTCLAACFGATFYLYVFAVPLGIMFVFLFTLLHETSHSTVFKNANFNKGIAWACGIIILIPPNWFRYFHFAHHRYTHDPKNDPELASPKPQTRLEYIWHVSGLPVWASLLKTIFRNAFGKNTDSFVPEKRRALIKSEAQIMLGLYGLVLVLSTALGSWIAIYFWIVPMLLGQPFLRLYLLAEHTDCPHDADMFVNTRTTFTTAMIRFLAWNMPYHAEHHAYPSVPFHKLPMLHRRVQAHLKSTANGYVAFHRAYDRQLQGQLSTDQ